MIDPALISSLSETMRLHREVQMITAASVFTAKDDVTNPNMVKVVLDRDSDALYFSRSAIPYVRTDGVRPKFYLHQGIYGFSTKFLLQFVKWRPGILEKAESLEQLRALENGAKIRVVIARQVAVSVDTPEDVVTVEAMLRRTR
jgi:3-deoxy-manno-octulosonate cytidylyltransferase (CMP-KDO synthetase)